jgi:hypothetical protein
LKTGSCQKLLLAVSIKAKQKTRYARLILARTQNGRFAKSTSVF